MTTATKTQHVVSDLEYDWLTVMQNKAKALQAYDQYIQDAHTANSQECADFFSQLKQTEAQQLQEIRKHLMKTMSNR